MPTAPPQTVTIGLQFRSIIADCDARWEVTRTAGPDVWRCTVVDEPYEYDGVTYPGEYAGTTDVFDTSTILAAARQAAVFAQLAQEDADALAALPTDTVVHLHHSGDAWLRGTITDDDGIPVLLVTDLVGNWRDMDMPRRLADGTVTNRHHADKIGTQIRMTGRRVYECHLAAFDHDPATLPAVDPARNLPDPTADEAAAHAKAALRNRVAAVLADHTLTVDAQLTQARTLLAESY